MIKNDTVNEIKRAERNRKEKEIREKLYRVN